MAPPAFWTPPTGVRLLKQTKRERVITLPSGERAKVTLEGTAEDGYVEHIETDDRIDAIAYPKTTRYTFGAH